MGKTISHRENANGSRGPAPHTCGTTETRRTGQDASAEGGGDRASLSLLLSTRRCGRFGHGLAVS